MFAFAYNGTYRMMAIVKSPGLWMVATVFHIVQKYTDAGDDCDLPNPDANHLTRSSPIGEMMKFMWVRYGRN